MKRNIIVAALVAACTVFVGVAQTTPSQTTPSQTTPSSGNRKDKKMEKKDSTGTSSPTQKRDTTKLNRKK
ncbi:MAG: hypothetical protein MUD08_03115 [Cytophagales bacterium]|jgi:hypothetical protein|nr:hypothetical protein [Cytophagales bacterium]